MGLVYLADSLDMLPLRFEEIYQERIWGGRELEKLYRRSLPREGVPYGEAWEISDREEAQSVVISDGGEFAGMTLNQLWSDEAMRTKLFGDDLGVWGGRFPLLVKILDCREDLSVQVHPPAERAAELGGESKTEMWYVAGVDQGAKLYAGVKQDVTKDGFEKALNDGTVAEQLHRIEANVGESIFIPSGRLHAIGAGHLIYEVQENSDTTFRVFDWNRLGLNGEPRELHVEQSMACINFDDKEPSMDLPDDNDTGGKTLACCEYFQVDELELELGVEFGNIDVERFSIITVVSGELKDAADRVYVAGDFMILPRGESKLCVTKVAKVLQTIIPKVCQ